MLSASRARAPDSPLLELLVHEVGGGERLIYEPNTDSFDMLMNFILIVSNGEKPAAVSEKGNSIMPNLMLLIESGHMFRIK